MKSAEKKIGKKGLLAILIVVIALTIFFIFDFFGDYFEELWALLKNGDQEEMEAFLNGQSEIAGLLAIFAISVLQVVSIVIPGMVIQVAAAVIYGWWRAFLACFTGFVAGNALVFVIARLFKDTIMDAFGTSLKNNVLTKKINDKNAKFVFALACMIPGIPNGSIPYVAAMSPIKTLDYAEAVAMSSWIQIILNCVIGHFLMQGDWLYMWIALGAQIGLIIVLILNRQKLLDRV